MAMALIHRRIGRQAVQIAFPFHVVDPDSLRLADHDIQRVIIMGSVPIFELDEILDGIISGFMNPPVNAGQDGAPDYVSSSTIVKSAMRTYKPLVAC